MDFASLIRDVNDFPKAGIVFKDITPLIGNGPALKAAVQRMSDPWRGKGVTKIVAAEARGFIFGTGMALELGCGFVPLRKPGKLPYKTRNVSYSLEYGVDTLCVHEDAVGPTDKVLLVDDLLATGGTIGGACELVREMGADIVGMSFLIELSFLDGRKRLPIGVEVDSVLIFGSE